MSLSQTQRENFLHLLWVDPPDFIHLRMSDHIIWIRIMKHIMNKKDKIFTNVLLEINPKDSKTSFVCFWFIQSTGISISGISPLGRKWKLNKRISWLSINTLTESGMKGSISKIKIIICNKWRIT